MILSARFINSIKLRLIDKALQAEKRIQHSLRPTLTFKSVTIDAMVGPKWKEFIQVKAGLRRSSSKNCLKISIDQMHYYHYF